MATKTATASNSATEDLSEQIDALKEDLANLKSAGAAVAREKFGNARRTVGDVYADGKKKAISLEHDFESLVQDAPIKAVLIAAGAGLLAGIFWMRR